MLNVVGLGLVGTVSFILFILNYWTPWDTKRLWDKYGDMAVVRRKVRRCKLPLMGGLGAIWVAGIALQLIGG